MGVNLRVSHRPQKVCLWQKQITWESTVEPFLIGLNILIHHIETNVIPLSGNLLAHLTYYLIKLWTVSLS